MAVSCDDGSCWTWGNNKDGQLGHGNTFNAHAPARVQKLDGINVTGVFAGGGHTAAVVDGGKTVYIFGRGRRGQIGRQGHIESVAAYRPEPLEVDFFKNKNLKV